MVSHMKALLVKVHHVSIQVLVSVGEWIGLDLVGWVGLVGLNGCHHIILPVVAVQNIVIGASHQFASITTKAAFELVENQIVLVQITQLGSEVLVNLDGLHRLALHVDVPQLEGEVVTRENVTAVSTELTVADGGNDLGEERASRGVFRLFKVFGVLITQGILSSIVQLDGTLTATVHK